MCLCHLARLTPACLSLLLQNYTQYIPLSIYDLQTWMGSPSIFVYDCSNAGIIVKSFKQFALQREQELEVGRRHPAKPHKTSSRHSGSVGRRQRVQATAGRQELLMGDLSYASANHKSTHARRDTRVPLLRTQTHVRDWLYWRKTVTARVKSWFSTPPAVIQSIKWADNSKSLSFASSWTQTHTNASAQAQTHSSIEPKFPRRFIFLLPFLSPGYGMLCESLMSRRCHSSQLFMAKFQLVCTLAGRRAAAGGGGAGEEGAEWTAPGAVSGSRCERRLKGKVKAAAKLLSRCSIWQNSGISSPSLSTRCFSAQVRRGHGRAAPSGLKSIVWLVKYQKCLFEYLGNQRRRIALVRFRVKQSYI